MSAKGGVTHEEGQKWQANYLIRVVTNPPYWGAFSLPNGKRILPQPEEDFHISAVMYVLC